MTLQFAEHSEFEIVAFVDIIGIEHEQFNICVWSVYVATCDGIWKGKEPINGWLDGRKMPWSRWIWNCDVI